MVWQKIPCGLSRLLHYNKNASQLLPNSKIMNTCQTGAHDFAH